MRQAPPTAAGRPADFERAKIAREVAQLRIIEALVVEHQHGVAVDRLPDRIDRLPIDPLAEINPADFGDEMRIDLPNLDGHASILHQLRRKSAALSYLSMARSSSRPVAIARTVAES